MYGVSKETLWFNPISFRFFFKEGKIGKAAGKERND